MPAKRQGKPRHAFRFRPTSDASPNARRHAGTHARRHAGTQARMQEVARQARAVNGGKADARATSNALAVAHAGCTSDMHAHQAASSKQQAASGKQHACASIYNA